ncbi:ankyrin repeat domain-containing protein [Ruminococcus sp.]|uniref:ankyrin repeat domain-containing protein n=1 Tax=Ruminococcus sp. TaxID=41978 RepID=UPI0025DF7EBE|nr:ankyrin repeat domain-containing protein [Ruminococcus sp.]
MDISLIAKLKKYDDFIELFQSGDEKKLYNGQSLLFYSLSNNVPEERYKISMFLLEKETDACGVNEYGENLFHILFSRVKHDLPQTLELCKELIDRGADLNQIDEKGRVPLQYIINMKYTDDELDDLYRVWFSHGKILTTYPNIWGKTPIDLMEIIPYRKKLLEIAKCHCE